MCEMKTLWDVFVDAISENSFDEARKIAALMKEKGEIDEDRSTDSIPLLNVIAWGWFSATEILLESGANINFCLSTGETALSTLIDEEMSEEINARFLKLFVKYDVNFELKVVSKLTALQLASIRGCFDIVRFLVNHGANINAQANIDTRETALQKALSRKHYKIAKFLLDSGADPYIENADGRNLMQKLSFTTIDELKDYIDQMMKTDQAD